MVCKGSVPSATMKSSGVLATGSSNGIIDTCMLDTAASEVLLPRVNDLACVSTCADLAVFMQGDEYTRPGVLVFEQDLAPESYDVLGQDLRGPYLEQFGLPVPIYLVSRPYQLITGGLVQSMQ